MIILNRVVMNASALPDPKEVSYDLLLRCAPDSVAMDSALIVS